MRNLGFIKPGHPHHPPMPPIPEVVEKVNVIEKADRVDVASRVEGADTVNNAYTVAVAGNVEYAHHADTYNTVIQGDEYQGMAPVETLEALTSPRVGEIYKLSNNGTLGTFEVKSGDLVRYGDKGWQLLVHQSDNQYSNVLRVIYMNLLNGASLFDTIDSFRRNGQECQVFETNLSFQGAIPVYFRDGANEMYRFTLLRNDSEHGFYMVRFQANADGTVTETPVYSNDDDIEIFDNTSTYQEIMSAYLAGKIVLYKDNYSPFPNYTFPTVSRDGQGHDTITLKSLSYGTLTTGGEMIDIIMIKRTLTASSDESTYHKFTNYNGLSNLDQQTIRLNPDSKYIVSMWYVGGKLESTIQKLDELTNSDIDDFIDNLN